MNNNLRLYPWYNTAVHFIAWMPIFFLYFSETLSLKEVILLEAIYYITVVILEVPSGYFSDVIGRKVTLLGSALFLVLASLFYLWGTHFWIFVLGQMSFAGWMAFQSGTNTVFHFESLKAENRESEYGDREAFVNKLSMYGSGAAALIGGLLGSYHLTWPYYFTLVAAVMAVVFALLFKEPKAGRSGDEQAQPVTQQIQTTIKYIGTKPLGWIFAYLVVIYVLAHVPYEFYQPYLKLLEGDYDLGGMKAPLISGLLYAMAMFLGAWATGQSMNAYRKFGLKKLLFFSLFLMLGIVGLLSVWLHPALMVIILIRSIPRALIKAPINSIITPRIAAGQRATFHSMISLANRLAFFGSLFGLSFIVSKEQLTDWPTLSLLFLICVGFGIFFTIPILWQANKHLKDL